MIQEKPDPLALFGDWYEEAAKSEQYKRVLDNWRAFRAEQHRWFSIADARTEMAVYTLPQ